MLHLERDLKSIMDQLMRVHHRFPDDIQFDNFVQQVEDGDLQVFPIRDDTVMVGQIREDTVRIVAAAGTLKDILDYLPIFCDWYKHCGCTTATLGGRRGWSKFLLDMGWRHGDFDGELVKDLTQ